MFPWRFTDDLSILELALDDRKWPELESPLLVLSSMVEYEPSGPDAAGWI